MVYELFFVRKIWMKILLQIIINKMKKENNFMFEASRKRRKSLTKKNHHQKRSSIDSTFPTLKLLELEASFSEKKKEVRAKEPLFFSLL